MGQIGKYKEVTRVVDGDGVLQSAAITERTVNYKATKDEGDFFKIYVNGIDALLDIPESSLKLFLLISSKASYANVRDDENYGGQMVNIRKDVRTLWCSKLGISERAYFNHMKKLMDARLIRKIDTYNYQVNPSFVGRGLLQYSPTRGYGGIGELRTRFNSGATKTETTVETDADVKAIIDSEIDALYERKAIENCKERKQTERQIHSLKKDRAALNDNDYTMTVTYSGIEPDESLIEDWSKINNGN